MPNVDFPSASQLAWIDDMSLRCGDITLQLTSGLNFKPSSDETISLYKDSSFVQKYMDCLHGRSIRNMVEVGVKHGGSAVFFWHLLGLNKLSCVELNDSAPNLSAYITRQKLDNAFYTHFGVDQADSKKLREIMAQDFGEEAIDLVIDDASHLYAPSLATFETLFPLISPGGLYILEDWRASLLFMQRSEGFEGERRLDSLVHEVLDFSTINPNIIPSIACNENFVCIERGEGSLPREGFSLANPFDYLVLP